jgi:hypothetical protein
VAASADLHGHPRAFEPTVAELLRLTEKHPQQIRDAVIHRLASAATLAAQVRRDCSNRYGHRCGGQRRVAEP